ncbi:MAG: Y-family DNA polymerase [Acutalibacter sp.]
MAGSKKQYACIDLKSYYASVECVDRGLDPLTTNLVVADESRSDGTICLAVSPSLKALGVPGRPRLFEVKERLAQIKATTGKEVEYITAVPRMARYLEVSSQIYGIYLQFLAAQDIHVYSIDEAFMDLTHYRTLYNMTAHQLVTSMIREVLDRVGITATGGIGPNLYLAKIAMDITAKKMPAGQGGVRVAELDELSFREKLWTHQPLTDFWQIGPGIAARLERLGVHTMGDLARLSLQAEEVLFREFGVDAEILIDHAWGIEPCGMEEIKSYRPATKSLASGQVLPRAYSWEEGRLAVKEMTEQVVLGLVEQGYAAEGVTLYVGYQTLNRNSAYSGPVKVNHYGRRVPPSVHGTGKLGAPTASLSRITQAVLRLYDKLVNRELEVRRMSIAAIRLTREETVAPQLSLYADHQDDGRETALLKATIGLHKRYGKNAVVKGMDLLDAATTIERNGQIGGHRK